METPIDKTYDFSHITKSSLNTAVLKFIGEISQKPPLYSALKKNGERLYKKARRGEKINIKSRKVIVDEFLLTEIKIPKISFKITCGKGTYIRSIAYDLGAMLNSGSYLSKLCRTNIGKYQISDSFTISDFKKNLNQ